MGFRHCTAEPGTYYKIIGEEIITLLIYVDDALFMGSNKTQVLAHKAQFMKQWESRDLGQAKEYLGMRIIRDRKKRTISLDQSRYAEKVVKRFGQENCKPVSVPLPTGYNPRPHSTQNQSNATLRSRYQSVIGSLLYIMLGTRPDIAFAVIKMSQFSSNPTEEHLQKALYIVHYLSSSPDLCIMYSGTGNHNGLCAYSDTDWAGDVETSHSTTGYAIFLGNGIVSWLSRRQRRVTLSSTEAAYCGMTETAKQLHWIHNIYEELHFKLGPLPLCIDNQGAIFLASNPAQEGRTKHVRMTEYFIREAVEFGEIQLYYVPTDQQFADIFTKNLGKHKFEDGRKALRLT
jgi:hypothetical protein